jgi:hypothetical protein
MQTEFSVEGNAVQKTALLQDAMRKFGLSLERHFSAFFGDVLNYGRSFDGCIVGQPGTGILTAGGRKADHFVLPGDYGKALAAIGRFFSRGSTTELNPAPAELPKENPSIADTRVGISRPSAASNSFVFVFRHSPRVTRPQKIYLDEVLAATCGATPGDMVLLRDCASPPDLMGVLMEVTLTGKQGQYGMQPLDQYDVMHWNFTDADAGRGIVVRAAYRPDPEAARKREAREEWARSAVATAFGGMPKPPKKWWEFWKR